MILSQFHSPLMIPATSSIYWTWFVNAWMPSIAHLPLILKRELKQVQNDGKGNNESLFQAAKDFFQTITRTPKADTFTFVLQTTYQHPSISIHTVGKCC